MFANADPDAHPLADVLEGVSELVATSGIGLETLRFRERVIWELDVNWKNGLENYLECYHCPTAHPGLSKLVDVDPDSYALIPRALSTSQVSAVRPGVREGKVKAPYIPATDVDDAQYHFLWPATTINIEPGRPNLGIDAWIPAGPARRSASPTTTSAPTSRTPRSPSSSPSASRSDAEDDGLVRNVQAGLDSGVVPQGRLLLNSEPLLGHFQRLVFDALQG